MTVFDARIQDGKLVLSPEQAAELGLREGDAMPVTIQAQEENPFVRWIGTLPPLPESEDSAQFYRRLRDAE